MYFWYKLVTYLFYPFASFFLFSRKLKKKEHPIRYKEKLSQISTPRDDGFLIWFHVASVGEAMSILPLIENLPQSYNTIIGENGIRLSGGQKQRVSIARAILKDSSIILLDEATSSLDAESEETVQNAIINLTENKTTLVIAHRLSTIIRADKIIVLKQGKIVETGKHKDLLENSIIYKNLYSRQLSAH